METTPPVLVHHDRDSATLAWTPVPRPNTTYILEQRHLPDGDWNQAASDLDLCEYRLEGKRPDIDYEFRIRAKNEYGISEPTDPLYVKQVAGK